MKQLFFFVIFVFSCTCSGLGQTYSEYNIEGDQAFNKGDYVGALGWYAEGITNCDQYSIKKLTEIWKEQTQIRSAMRILMPRCLNCLTKQVEKEEGTEAIEAMLLLSDYYKHGIGTEKDSVTADFWLKKHVSSLGYVTDNNNTVSDPETSTAHQSQSIEPVLVPEKNRFRFLLLYSYSPTMPFGITMGTYRKYGIYFSARTNFSFRNNDYDCNDTKVLNYNKKQHYAYLNNKKEWNNYAFSLGTIIPVFSDCFSATFGIGYGKRKLLCQLYEYEYTVDYTKDPPSQISWCYNQDSSYKGILLEIGGMYRYKKIIVNGGIYSIAMKDLDMYAGIGYLF